VDFVKNFSMLLDKKHEIIIFYPQDCLRNEVNVEDKASDANRY